MLLTGKVKEAVTRVKDGSPVYDAVVLDAPPTGRIPRFLNISHEIGALAKVGPLKSQSDGVMAVLTSEQTAVHLVTLLEEMPVQETLDAVTELTDLGLPVGGVVVNAVRSPVLSPADLHAAERGALDLAGAAQPACARGGLDPALAAVLAEEAADHAARVALEERGRDALAALDRPSYELPLLPDAVDLGGLYAAGPAAHRAGAGMSASTWTHVAGHRADHRVLRLRRASARRPPPRRWRCGAPSAGGGRSCSPSTRPGGWPSRWG